MSYLPASASPAAQSLVLIAEDEAEIAEILAAYLQRHGLRTLHAADGRAALAMHQTCKPDLLLLDVQMPQLDGWQVLSEIRARGDTPVIMLTALDQDLDKLMGLRMGADDYVVKPFNPAEVVARVQAVLRRSQAAKQATARVLRVGPFQIDLESHEASLCRDEGQLVLDLTLTEFKLLASLMRAPKRVFSRAELLTHCLPEGDTQERTVDSHISKLRKKLEAHGIQGVPASVWGVGYRFGGRCMTSAPGLRRQIIRSLGLMALGIISLAVIGTYVFYAIAVTYVPGSISESWIPSRVEMLWIGSTILIALGMALYVAVRLSRRILTPLNSVANSLREVAEGRLDARVPLDEQAIGETAQLVRDFNTMAERLQSMTREREFWNAAIAHELRTPVTILRGRLQGLAEGVFPPERALFEGLLRQVEGLTHLIEDLRVLSLNDSGHLELQRTEVRLADELSVVLDAFASPLAASGFMLKRELDAELLVCCDALRIRQALMALLENAQKHGVPGLLTVRLYRSGTLCILSVEDEGPGISEEVAAHIFDVFRRGDPSRSRKSGGSGLGLAVVKAIVEAHGGSVVCQPTERGGTIFTLSWPI